MLSSRFIGIHTPRIPLHRIEHIGYTFAPSWFDLFLRTNRSIPGSLRPVIGEPSRQLIDRFMMQRRQRAVLIHFHATRLWCMVGFCIGIAGCWKSAFVPHIVNVPREPPALTTSLRQDDRELDQHLLQVLADELSANAWQPNRDWTPLDNWRRAILGEGMRIDLRWRFHHLAAQKTLSELDETHEEATTHAATEKSTHTENSYWPMSPLMMLERTETSIPSNDEVASNEVSTVRNSNQNPEVSEQKSAAIEYLRELSKRHDRIGWNAVILLGQRTPQTCDTFAPLLEKIVRGDTTIVRGQSPSSEKNSATVTSGATNTNPKPIDVNRSGGTTNLDSPATSAPAQAEVDTTTTLTDDASTAPPTEISAAMRAAAAEAWCLVLIHQNRENPSTALARAIQLLEDPTLEVVIRGELFSQLSRWISPVQIPTLTNAMQSAGNDQRGPIEIRRMAMLACANHAVWQMMSTSSTAIGEESYWPTTIWNCRNDPDPLMRRYFIQWLSVSGLKTPALEIIKGMNRDADPMVRREAIVALGRLSDASGVEELRRLLTRDEEPIRVAAICGLCQRHPREASRYLSDPSVAVRRALAKELANQPTAEALPMLDRLIVDRDPTVQLTAAESCITWPDQFAVPVLYTGSLDGYLATRQQCFDQLRRRTGIVGHLNLDESRAARQASADDFLERAGLMKWVRVVHAMHVPAINSAESDARELYRHETRQKWESLRSLTAGSLVDRDAIQALMTVNDVPELEKILDTASTEERILLIDVILPALAPEYLAIKNLNSEDVGARRDAADRLERLSGERRSLGPAAARLLRERLLYEQDRIVWQRAMAAIMPDGTDEAAEIALLALNHQWPDVRQLGCRFIIRHPHPARGAWLLPLLNDDNPTVQLLAIEGAGLCQNPIVLDGLPARDTESAQRPDVESKSHSVSQVARGLRPLLRDSHIPVRLATAIAMCRLGDDQAMQQLLQWSQDGDPRVRERGVMAMGTSRHRRFIETLVNQGWTEPDPGVQLAILRSLNELVPEENRPRGLTSVQSPAESLKVWMEWWKLSSSPDKTSESRRD